MSTFHFRSLRRACLPFALLGATLLLRTHDARANSWPPAAGADLTNPMNWPNDPGYSGQWNFWSWLPKQDPGTLPYLDADTKLGAAGMSIDKAWTLSIGSPAVRIAILDSGI